MKKVGNFQTEDPKRLSEQLDRFQDAVDQETANIRAGFIPQLEQLSFSSSSAVTATLLPGQIGLCDSSLGNVTVVLSTAAGKSPPPGWLAVIKRFAANNVTVRPSGLAALNAARRVNATTSVVFAAAGVHWLYFDGSDWWSV
jgi:hypothetical protein